MKTRWMTLGAAGLLAGLLLTGGCCTTTGRCGPCGGKAEMRAEAACGGGAAAACAEGELCKCGAKKGSAECCQPK